jgi:hypothetical protein
MAVHRNVLLIEGIPATPLLSKTEDHDFSGGDVLYEDKRWPMWYPPERYACNIRKDESMTGRLSADSTACRIGAVACLTGIAADTLRV